MRLHLVPDLTYSHINIIYSESGRGIPDISAQALNFITYYKHRATPVYGTSVSAAVSLFLPLLTVRCSSLSTQLTANVQIAPGIIALLHDYELEQGKPPLGSLNPWLYSNGLKDLNDVKNRTNPGCNTIGFGAIEEWDPVRPASLVYNLSPFFDPRHV